MPETYPQQLCDAEDLLRRSRYIDAVRAFESLSKLEFHETPNFEILADLARAQCFAGQAVAGKSTLRELAVSLDYYAGKRSCVEKNKDSSAESIRAERRMCSNEILHDSHKYTPQSVLSRVVRDVTERRLAAQSLCDSAAAKSSVGAGI